MKFEDLYGNIAPRLTNYLVSSGSSYAEACDLVQDVFLKIWNMREDLNDSEESVSGLAFTMARNLRKNMFRHDSRITFTDTIPEDSEPNVDNTKAITSSDAAYLRQRLNKAFAALPPTLREAYTMFQVGGLSIKEIAHETGVGENLVKVRIFRAKEKLKPLLEDLHVTF